MPKVSAEHKEGVRRRIIDAARTCLERNGFQDVTTRELLAEAGLSVGTFYNYFPSKEHLYGELAEEMLAADLSVLHEQVDEGQPVAVTLLSFLSEYPMTRPKGAVAVSRFRSRVTAEPDAVEAVQRLNRYVVEQFTPMVEKAKADGWVRDDVDTEALVELIDIVWDGLGRREATDSFQTSYQRVGATLMDLLFQGALGEAGLPQSSDVR